MKDDLYVEFDNGKKLSPKDVVDIIVRLRKTGSGEELVFSLIKEYDFTIKDLERFRQMLLALVDNWELFDKK